MSTKSIVEPMVVKSSELEKLKSDVKLNSSFVKIIKDSKSIFDNVGNIKLVKNLKL